MKRILFIALALAFATPTLAAITKTQEQRIEVEANGRIFVETITIISEDGKELTRSSHRMPYEPDGAKPPGRAGDIADEVWTPAVKQAYTAEKAARTKALEDAAKASQVSP